MAFLRFSKTPEYGFMRFRIPAMLLSAVLVLASIALLFTKGLNLGIDFSGGVLVEIQTAGKADLSDLRQRVGALKLQNASLQQFGDDRTVLIRFKAEDTGKAIETLKAALPADIEYRRTEYVGPAISDELMENSFWALVFSLIGIMIYIWLRFEWQFGLGALLALFHDIMTTVGLFALLGLDFDLTTVAALLTIAGYSINDTVVVYDRVRENLRKYKKKTLNALVDLSLNETLSRTILTSITTFIALLCLYFFGSEALAGFSLAMLWGVVIGTYSSVFVASPLLETLGLRREAFTQEVLEPAG